MTSRHSMLAAASLLAVVAVASSAAAQTRTAAAAPAITQGPAIPGLCILSVSQAISTSTVGQYVKTRLSQIVAQVKAELSPEDSAIGVDVKSLEASRAALDTNTYQTRGNALQVRINNLREKADLRQREVKATEDKALNRIAQELEPIAQQLYQQRHCSALFDKGSVMLANPDIDLTPSAVAALNGRIQQFAFDREHLDTGAPTAR